LAFMLVEVPEPVWKISSTNSESHLAIRRFLRGLDDGGGGFGIKPAQFLIGDGGVLLNQGQRANE